LALRSFVALQLCLEGNTVRLLVLSVFCAQDSAKAQNTNVAPRIQLTQNDAVKRLDEKLKAVSPASQSPVRLAPLAPIDTAQQRSSGPWR
jgi:hypothetical protein